MQVINVIERSEVGGLTVHSFPITELSNKAETIVEAENLFISILRENADHLTEEEIDVTLDNAFFQQGQQYELYLIWSENNTDNHE